MSDDGRVASLVSRFGTRGRPLVMKPKVLPSGHHAVGLVGERGGKQRWVGVHVVVLEAHVGPCPEGHEGSHVDGDPAHNARSNLAWETPVENNARKAEHGTQPRGEELHNAKLTDDAVREIRRRYVPRSRRGEGTAVGLAAEFGVHRRHVLAVASGDVWRHVE